MFRNKNKEYIQNILINIILIYSVLKNKFNFLFKIILIYLNLYKITVLSPIWKHK